MSDKRCAAELIYPAGQIDRCQRDAEPRHVWHYATQGSGGSTTWEGGTARERAWEETQGGFIRGWKSAGRTDPPPLYELGPAFTGSYQN